MIMRHPDTLQKLALAALIVTSLLLIFSGAVWGASYLSKIHSQSSTTTAQADNIAVGGFPMAGNPAPDFNLTNQFGQLVSLSSFRGHEVVLAFIDSRCTTICPLTAEIMYNARTELGTADANKVVLVAVNANPVANSVASVQNWSITHGMLHQWSFLTGSAKQLQTVYNLYKIYDQVSSDGQAVHDPAILVIDSRGLERLYFETLDSTNQSDLNSQIIGLEAGMKQWLS